MKFSKKYLSLAIVFGIMSGLYSCTDEADYNPAEELTNGQVYFSNTASTDVNLNENQTAFTVTINRLKGDGDLTVNLSSSSSLNGASASGVFSIPSSVSFANGQTEASINIGVVYDYDDPKTYELTLSIEGEDGTPYGKSTIVLSVVYAPWTDWELMDDYAFVNLTMVGGGNVTVLKRSNLLDPTQIQYMIPSDATADKMESEAGFKEKYPNYEFYTLWTSADMYINVYTDQTVPDNDKLQIVRVPMCNADWINADYPVFYTDTYTFFADIYSQKYPGTVNPAGYANLSYFNSETGLVTMNLAWIAYPGQYLGYYEMGTNSYLQLPGYPDLTMTMSNNGSYVSETGQEYALINILKGADVATYTVTLVNGWLEGDQEAIQEVADELAADRSAVHYSESQEMQFPVSEDDYYTVVTVLYDEDNNVVGNAAYSFYYELVQKDWNEGWTTVTEEAVFTDGWNILSAFWGYPQQLSWMVEVQSSDYVDGYYRIVLPYASCPYLEPGDYDRGHYYIDIDATNPDQVWVDPSFVSIGLYVASIAPGTFDGNTFSFEGGTLAFYYGGGWLPYNDEDSDMLVLDISKLGDAKAKSKSVVPFKTAGQPAMELRKGMKETRMPIKPANIDQKKVLDYKLRNLKTSL